MPWHQVQVEYCDVTGQLLPRRYWSFEADGRTLRTTGPQYEALYHEYVEPLRRRREAERSAPR
jgi:hypothetical protein